MPNVFLEVELERYWERNVRAEARNIARNAPVFPGDTISHATAKECEKRGWIERNESGDWIATKNCPFQIQKTLGLKDESKLQIPN